MEIAIGAEIDLRAATIPSRGKQLGPAADQTSPRAWESGRMQEAAARSLRVLIIEDDLTIGPLLAETLEQLGHVVCALEVDAAAAVSAARRCRPDLMIVDIGLGESSGILAVRQILKDGFVPHVVVTGDGLRGLPLGLEAVVLQKPYRISDIVAAIARAIDGATKPDEPGTA